MSEGSRQREKMEPSCGNCRFWKNGDQTCRRRAPSVQWISAEFTDRKAYKEDASYQQTMFPVTHSLDWCGEHLPKGS